MGKDLERFTPKLPDYLHCNICLEAAYPPVPYCTSEHPVCLACFDKTGRTVPPTPCPTCRGPLRPTIPFYIVSSGRKRAIEGYGYKCSRAVCSYVGTVDTADTHELVCPFRRVTCGACKQDYQAYQKTTHDAMCPGALIDSPRGGRDCGGTKNGGRKKRSLMPKHEAVCSMHNCSVPGCTTRTTPANMPAHESGCRDKLRTIHRTECAAECLAEDVQMLKTKLAGAETALEETRAKCEAAEADLARMEEELREATTAASPQGTVDAAQNEGRAGGAGFASAASGKAVDAPSSAHGTRRSMRLAGGSGEGGEPAGKKQKTG